MSASISLIVLFFLNFADWFPKMCSCLEAGAMGTVNFPSGQSKSYKRLGSGPTLFDLGELMHRTKKTEISTDETIDDERQVSVGYS